MCEVLQVFPKVKVGCSVRRAGGRLNSNFEGGVDLKYIHKFCKVCEKYVRAKM
jgi:hypothetical protein